MFYILLVVVLIVVVAVVVVVAVEVVVGLIMTQRMACHLTIQVQNDQSFLTMVSHHVSVSIYKKNCFCAPYCCVHCSRLVLIATSF